MMVRKYLTIVVSVYQWGLEWVEKTTYVDVRLGSVLQDTWHQ